MESSQFFYVCDGQVLRSLEDLSGSLQHDMSEETFRFHCNAEKNDFANWVKDVLGNKKLAQNIGKVKSKQGMLKKLGKK